MNKKEPQASEDLTLLEEFQSIDAMVSAFDAEGDGPLRKGESAFNWSLVEERCLPLAELSKDLRVGIWLIRAALASLQIERFQTRLMQLANWTELPAEELHPTPLDGEDEIHALILGWLACPAFLYGLGQLKVCAAHELTLTELESGTDLSAAFTPEQRQESAQVLLALIDALQRIEQSIFQGYGTEGRSLIKACQLLERCLKKVEPAHITLSGTDEVNQATHLQPLRALNSRSDVSDMLSRMVAYFQAHEPSHPAPIFLNRVQRMLGANFETLMDELYPEADQLIAKLERPKAG